MVDAKVRTIIFGSTGMVGEGVLHVSLQSEDVEKVLVINRRPCGVVHPKLEEILLQDLRHVWMLGGTLSGYTACFFCAGVSSIGMDEHTYRRITYDLTMHAASTLLHHNPGLVFTYVSGLGTDGLERSRTMWARVKGRTENHLLRMPFKAAYMFRPGVIQPVDGLTHTYPTYRVFAPILPVVRRLFPSHVVSLKEIGRAMINVSLRGFPKHVLECKDIASAAV